MTKAPLQFIGYMAVVTVLLLLMSRACGTIARKERAREAACAGVGGTIVQSRDGYWCVDSTVVRYRRVYGRDEQ